MGSYPLLFVVLAAAGVLGAALAIAATSAAPRPPAIVVSAEHRPEGVAPDGQTATV
jgi:hypothetical protein